MILDNILCTSHLVQVIDILRDDAMETSHPLQFPHPQVGLIWPGLTDHLIHLPEHLPDHFGLGPE